MYAVVDSGANHYRVEKDQLLRVEKLPGGVGDAVSFDKILLVSDGENLEVGRPFLDHGSVEGHIVEQQKSKKTIVFKYKRRNRYRNKQGHRQAYTTVKIEAINPT